MLLQNKGIIRNSLKIISAIKNAQVFLELQAHYDGFHRFLWGFVNNSPMQNHWRNASEIPVTTPESDQLSKVLKKAGCTFVGSKICYAYMQAMGLVNDHIVSCPQHQKVKSGREK